MIYYRKYGVQTTVDFDLFEVDGVDFRIDAVHASGDTKIMKDEGAEANTTNGFTDEGQGYSLVLTATEMQAARIKVYLVDQTATKVWLDTSLTIETYGNASAQHAVDLSDAVRAGLTALPNAVPGAANGLLIAGTNAPVTITGSGDALTLTSTGGNGRGLLSQGNGTGPGILGYSGTAPGIQGQGVKGIFGAAEAGSGEAGIRGNGDGAGQGIYGNGGASGPGAAFAAGGGNADGLTLTKAGTGKDINASEVNDILTDTAEIGTAGAGLTAVMTTQMTESYAANGVAPTPAEALFAIHQMLMQFGISGTNLTVRKLDDSTTAFVVTLNDSNNPTDAKRA